MTTEKHPLATDDQLALIETAESEGLLAYLTLNDLDGVTRLEMAKLMAAFMDLEVTPTGTSAFTDCAGLSDQERGVINAVVQEKLLAGFSSGEFRPEAVLTRGAAAKVYHRALGEPQTAWDHVLSDVTSDSPFQTPANDLYNLGLITGTSATTFSPANAADKETVLSWLVKGKSWTDARPVAPAVTGASFVKTPAAIRLEVQAPADMSNIEKFRLELKDSDGNWVDYGTFRGGVPINGDGLNGTYTRLRITSIPKDSSAYRPGVFKMDCMLTVTNTSGTAPDSVTFSRVTNATVEPGYCVQAEGLSADTMHVVAELAERENGDGMRSYMGGNAFFNETSSGKSINITLFDDFLSKLIPGGYYRILEVKQASVPDSATASLTVNTRGGWEKIPALGSITYGPVSDLHFTEEDYPVLTWTRPSVEVPGTRYCVYLSTDGGANWTFAHAARERDFLPLYLFVGGDYNGVKVTTEISGQEVASCISTDLSLHITRNDKTSTASLSVEPVTGGGYLYTVTSLSPRTNYTLFFGNAPGQFNSSRGFRTDSDGTWTRILDDPSGTRYGYYYIQEYSACAVSVDGKTASLTVSGCGGWQQV